MFSHYALVFQDTASIAVCVGYDPQPVEQDEPPVAELRYVLVDVGSVPHDRIKERVQAGEYREGGRSRCNFGLLDFALQAALQGRNLEEKIRDRKGLGLDPLDRGLLMLPTGIAIAMGQPRSQQAETVPSFVEGLAEVRPSLRAVVLPSVSDGGDPILANCLTVRFDECMCSRDRRFVCHVPTLQLVEFAPQPLDPVVRQ